MKFILQKAFLLLFFFGTLWAQDGSWKIPPTSSVWILPDGTKAILRPLRETPSDLKILYTILKDSDTTRMQRDGTPWPDASIQGTFNAYVAYWKIMKDFEKLGLQPSSSIPALFLVVGEQNQAIGFGGIQKNMRDKTVDEIHYALLPPYRRKALGTKMGTFIMEFYKKIYGDRPLQAIVVPENVPSRRLLSKLGFRPLLDEKGKQKFHLFKVWKNRRYDIFQYDPPSQKSPPFS